jgi:hypothetical protein
LGFNDRERRFGEGWEREILVRGNERSERERDRWGMGRWNKTRERERG